MNINKFTDPLRCWSYNTRILCPYFFLPPNYLEVQLALEKPRSSAYSLEFCLPKNQQQQTTTCNPSLNTDTALGGSIYEPEALRQYRNGQKSTILFRHSIQTVIQTHVSSGLPLVLMIPACCVQQDRFPTCEHGMTSRLLGCNHTSGRESRTSTKRSARNSPPSF